MMAAGGTATDADAGVDAGTDAGADAGADAEAGTSLREQALNATMASSGVTARRVIKCRAFAEREIKCIITTFL